MIIFTILGFSLALFVGILLFIELGRRIGRHRKSDGEAKGIGALEAGVFSLLGLLIAFTFSGATGRWETRRALVVEETNAIGTAYLRLDLLQPDDRARLRATFKEYVYARLKVYALLPDEEAAQQELKHAGALQNTIWTDVLASSRADSSGIAARLLLPALNEMFDITTTRTMAARAHPPKIIFIMLFLLALTASLIAGYGMAADDRPRWLHRLGYALMMAGSIYVILEIEYPRAGLIRLDSVDLALKELVQGWE
jgi:hypothetical protein